MRTEDLRGAQIRPRIAGETGGRRRRSCSKCLRKTYGRHPWTWDKEDWQEWQRKDAGRSTYPSGWVAFRTRKLANDANVLFKFVTMCFSISNTQRPFRRRWLLWKTSKQPVVLKGCMLATVPDGNSFC